MFYVFWRQLTRINQQLGLSNLLFYIISFKLINSNRKLGGVLICVILLLFEELQKFSSHFYEMKSYLSFCRENGCISPPHWFNKMVGESGPFWMRDYVQLKETQICNDVELVVQALGVERIVVGHNIMKKGQIETKCNGLIHFIDVGMSKSYYGNLAVWTCDQHNGPLALYSNGKVVKLQGNRKQEL
eukprot:TRINITY_DN614_c2_g1_i1.p2 TRINITY_DN614_c2_g1~~TRINITY_DN614_c2_g1_i1.p2  ORF type:complete len:187 (+),score=10.76 TRINITY_DN614_c2_g1_i1:322-882(+)